MQKFIVLLLTLILLLTGGINVFAAEQEQAAEKLTDQTTAELDLSQSKVFSEAARQQLLGIASQYDNEDVFAEQNTEVEIGSKDFTIIENQIKDKQNLNLLTDLNFNADYSKSVIDNKLQSEADLKLEYSLNPRTLIRAGYSVINEEGWDVQRNNSAGSLASAGDKTYFDDLESSKSVGLAYKSTDRVTVSADFIENNEFGSYYNENLDVYGNSTVFGLQYDDPGGSSIRARYQVDLGDDVTQRIAGVDFAFNNLATFSASYKLLDPKAIESVLAEEKTAWDLGLGVNLNDQYGVSLGYELIQSKDQSEEPEKKIKASFEINF